MVVAFGWKPAVRAVFITLLVAALIILFITDARAGNVTPGGIGGLLPTPTPAPVTAPPAGGGQLKWWRAVWTVEHGIRSKRISLRGFVITKAHRPVVGWRLTCELWKTRKRETCDRYPRFEQPVYLSARLPQSVRMWAAEIGYASKRVHLATNVIGALIMVESNGIYPTPCTPAYYYYNGYLACDIGLTQYGPNESDVVRGAYGYGAWSSDPQTNILTGAAFLRWTLDHCAAGNLYLALGKYNGGCGGFNAAYAASAWWYAGY